jgi:2-polyprenyl-3-methyl-5-hydroxy-6-metoxy-1,4-benzoquinol methylase
MINPQQQETWRYFSDSAAEWRKKAEGSLPIRVNVIKQRNDFVLALALRLPALKRSLDVGCGTGELVCALAKAGVKAVGVDFAAEMLALSQAKAENEGLAEAEFVHASIFDYKPGEVKFDLISANGFIEYISEPQLRSFIGHAKSLLAPGGSLVLGSRNRLFNAFSLNEYTSIELSRGVYDKLIAEAMMFAQTAGVRDAIAQLLAAAEPLPSIDSHPRTGIGVSTRNQYTPGELVRLLAEAGLTTKEIYPIHYHVAGPRFAREHPESHVEVANHMQGYASECHYLIPFASTFMLHAESAPARRTSRIRSRGTT